MPKITEKTLIPKGLADSILREVEKLLDEGFEQKKAVKLGISLGIMKWGKKDADKSGG